MDKVYITNPNALCIYMPEFFCKGKQLHMYIEKCT